MLTNFVYFSEELRTRIYYVQSYEQKKNPTNFDVIFVPNRSLK